MFNQITKGVEKLFANTHYESRILAETEVARCQSADIDKIVSFDSVKVLTLEWSNGTKYTLEKGENKISHVY